MIRCDIVKAKPSNNPVTPSWQAQPRKSDSFVLDLGNIGKYLDLGNIGKYLDLGNIGKKSRSWEYR